jgi:hypothetical protein
LKENAVPIWHFFFQWCRIVLFRGPTCTTNNGKESSICCHICHYRMKFKFGLHVWPFQDVWVIVDEVIGLVRLRKGGTYLFVSKTYFKFI